MPRPLIDSDHIFGIHEPGGEGHMLTAGKPGWVLFSETIGHDPQDSSSIDFTTFSSQGLGVICRLNNGTEPEGTIPHSSLYEEFAQRAARFVGASRGCKIWIIGNEMNYVVERPGINIDWSRHASAQASTVEDADPLHRSLAVRFNVLPDQSNEIRTTRAAMVSPGEMITPEMYARAYLLCRDAIHRLPGREDDQVLIGAVAPWNTQTIYAGNPNGDWVRYFQDILEKIGPANCDGFALHAYTQGSDPELIAEDRYLPPPFQQRRHGFRAFVDFMEAVPARMRHLPAYITETDQTGPWIDVNTGWVQRAYAEIDRWNRQPGHQQIRSLILYRWPKMDKWYIEGKEGVIDDFREALQNDYRWRSVAPVVAPAVITPPAPPPEIAEPEPIIGEVDASQEIEVDEEDTPVEDAEPEEPTLPTVPVYCAEWVDDRLPDRLIVGETISASITVKNAGHLTWSWGGGNPFRLGYDFYRNRRLVKMPVSRALRSDVPADVVPGDSVTIQAKIALPAEPGNYMVEFDLVHEGVTWFKEQGSEPLTRWITLEERPEETDGSGDVEKHLPVPLFADISTRLPRSSAPYARRSLNQIRYLVVSHTAANPRLRLDSIARTHIQHGYPGIVYDYIVDVTGEVYKVSELEDVAQPDQVWSEQGVNICLSGNFANASPPLIQLDAVGRLCAWLAQNLGLRPDAIIGLGELTRSDSPGDTFYAGPAWKEMLTRQVQLHLTALGSGADEGRSEQLTLALEEQNATNERLAMKLAEAEEELAELHQRDEELKADLLETRRQLAEAAADAADDRPRIHNVVDELPRDSDYYVARAPEQIETIVINHTGVSPAVPLLEITEAHRQDWPGLLYDFYIDGEGMIYQTQPLDEVVNSEQVYLARAINIAFAGEFDDHAPSEQQLAAGGRLIAWLMTRFAQLSVDKILGINEFIEHTSPGRQWLEGLVWKESLVAAVKRASDGYDPELVEGELRTRLQELERQLLGAQAANQTLQDQRLQAQSEIQRLQTELEESSQQTARYVVPKPTLHDIVERLPKHPSMRYERRARSQISHIAVHHTATPPTITPARIAELHVAPDPNRGKEAWPGIGYHYFVHADGSIDQVNALESASYHVFSHNLYSVGVVFAGSFMNGKIPTSAQLRSGAHLVAWLMQELKIPLARVWGHREFPDNNTVCPGSEWTLGNRWRDLLFERVQQVQSGAGVKGIRHYLLFWQRPYPGEMARQDFVNAIGYVSRFRPMLGFSVEEARNAEYVTIVGGEAGVSAASEATLRMSGCKVERIAGRDEEEAGRLLGELAKLGRRFRDFETDF